MIKILLALFAVLLVVGGGAALWLYQSELSREQLPEYVNDASAFVTLPSGAEVHYRDEGAPDGPVLYLFHGGLGSLHNWEGWIPQLGDTYRLVSLDFPAHGLTGRIPSDVYTRASMVGVARELAEHLALDSVVVAGNSMGGGIALQYALDVPEDVRGLVLIGSEGIPNTDEGYDASQFSDEAPLAPGDPGYAAVDPVQAFQARFYPSSAIRTVLDDIVGDDALLTDAFVERYGRILRHEGNRAANTLMFRQWLDPEADPRDLEPRLGEITVPVLYLHGAEDTTVPERVARAFDARLPDSELVIYDGVGHMAMIERPEATAADVRRFMETRVLGDSTTGVAP